MAKKQRIWLCPKCGTELEEEWDAEYDPINPPHIWVCPKKECAEIFQVLHNRLVSI